MKKFTVLSIVALSVSLASCSKIVGAAIPAQTISNPAGLEGKQLVASSPLMIESVRGTVSYSTAGAPFDDIQVPDLPFGIKPGGLDFKTGFSQIDVTGACVKPQTFTVTVRDVKVDASDDAASASFTAKSDAQFTLTRTSEGAGTAAYSVSDTKLNVSADVSAAMKFFSILTTGGKNTVSVTATISASDNGLAGCTMGFTLKDVSVTLSKFQ
ncbi:hypothetical protein GCM10008956_34240 [Deinococcus arenae]|uniref:Lipoprotein n=1 Tax=Deinococcus arenae TaxID=1452751 RepID=A0A8H9GS58_9DEIO|nr:MULTISPECIES: hypothetical protein [Deinococcus]AWT36758.1 hypothetical protein DM785_15245 [Deinococcus actinosclerus]GGM55502.1 hypothetical protein GCM10008956_34240 [Deinococcus arenae]